ncbi:6-bladed beta-propeller [Aliifodinibius sp. S!AR15-10]|uniref:6-bladed beta-propeller n=1 Tax=Aliifodinibius sp. S!AR15-10 TaxID=2950437 RepID=UPI002865EC33|nr:6-bladed beta-propeller [Aliifodinibius sp. S!AR15-10]MDR8391278.1 6-bladed beta-propeller [Aliifodinibius sp. S!AR15-10]
MKNRPAIKSIFILTLCISLWNCQNKDKNTGKIETKDIESVDLFIDFEQDGVVQPVSIEYIGDDQLAILDGKLKEVFLFNTDAEFQKRFGGEGKGPGEFSRPLYVSQTGDQLHVIDGNLMRASRFDRTGTFKESFPFEGNPFTSHLTVMGPQKYVAGTQGRENSLLKIVDLKEDTTIYFGQAMAESQVSPNLEQARQQLSNGEIPTLVKNDVKIFYDDAGNNIFVFLSAYSQLQKYDTKGKLIWKKDIDLKVNDAIFEQLVKRAEKSPEAAMPVVQHITAMKVVNGTAYLFWVPVEGHRRKIVKVGADGTIETIYNLPKMDPMFFDFTVDPASNTIFCTAPRMGQVYKASLP